MHKDMILNRSRPSPASALAAQADDAGEEAPLAPADRELAIERAIERAALDEGILDPGLAIKLVDRNLISVDARGRVEGADIAARVFRSERPSYFGPVRRQGGGSPPRPAMNSGRPGVDRTGIREMRAAMIRSGKYAKM